jgi:cytidylate kinase
MLEIVTIDGPAGAGKSTAAKELSSLIGWRYLDTGAMYRAITWKALQEDRLSVIDGCCDDLKAIAKMISNTELVLDGSNVLCDGIDVTTEIRRPDIATALKPIADSPECRAELVKQQKIIGSTGKLVTEGRDQGSVVFPDAKYKFYMDASVEERAQRRTKQEGGDYQDVLRRVKERDIADKSRPVGTLIIPKGATLIDTTGNTLHETVMILLAHMEINGFKQYE